MKNYDLFVLAEQLANNLTTLKTLKGAKFTYGILKNIDLLEKEIKFVSETAKPSEEFLAYDKARVALCEQYAKKDAEGNLEKKETHPGSNQFEYDIDTTSKEWNDAIDALKAQYNTIIESRDEQVKDYNLLIDSQNDLEFYLIKLDDVPNDISLDLMKLIKPFIKE